MAELPPEKLIIALLERIHRELVRVNAALYYNPNRGREPSAAPPARSSGVRPKAAAKKSTPRRTAGPQ